MLAAIFKVALNRLSWQRVWMIPPTSTSITAIAWRPDGKGEITNSHTHKATPTLLIATINERSA